MDNLVIKVTKIMSLKLFNIEFLLAQQAALAGVSYVD